MWKSEVLGKQVLLSVVRAGSVCGAGWQEARGQSGDLGARGRGWVKPGGQGRLLWCRLSSRRRQWHPLQYSSLENPMDGGAWWAAVHGVAKSQTRLRGFTFTFHFHALEKEMATHSSFLAWRIPGTGEPSGLPSVGSHRVGHD